MSMEIERFEKVVYYPGVWDMLHVGHVRALQQAKKFGTKLVVGLPTDKAVEEDKGKPPVIRLVHRMEMLYALSCVDIVRSYGLLSFLPALKVIKPDVFAIGTKWGHEERHLDAIEYCEKNAIRIVEIEYTEGISTTLIRKGVTDVSV